MKKRVIALGFFDGVHKGHMALMERARQRGAEKNLTSAVFTFDVHPSALITGQSPPFIMCPDYREQEIRRIGGIDEVIFCPFTKEVMEMDWKTFVEEILIEKYQAAHIITGENNHFGYKGKGTPALLAVLCAEKGIGYDCIPDVSLEGEVVSSTKIREMLEKGETERANRFLSHPFTVFGTVEHGKKRGREMGIKTANLPLPKGLCTPKFGVYITRAWVEGKSFMATTNVGKNPTFANKEPTIEPHILDFDQEIYGKEIRLAFYAYLRPEQRFETKQQLSAQILLDVAATRTYFSENPESIF